MANINHSALVAYFESMAANHVDLRDFYRYDLSEIMSKLRSSIETPALMLEAASIDLVENGAQSKHQEFDLAFMVLLPFKRGDHQLNNANLTTAEEIAMELERRITKDSEDPNHWLYSRYDASETSLVKAGPLFAESYHGYRCRLVLKNTNVKRMPNQAKWSDL